MVTGKGTILQSMRIKTTEIVIEKFTNIYSKMWVGWFFVCVGSYIENMYRVDV